MTSLVACPHTLNNNRKRVVLKRSTYQMNDPIVIKQKYKAKKSVKFTDVDEVRYFYKSHTPMQVHQELPYMTYSVDDFQVLQPNWSSRKSNFFYDNNNKKVRMEGVQLVDGDQQTMSNNQFILEGRCRALNMSFEKTVYIRYTTDLWKSYHEVQATYSESIQSNTWDRFYFNIPIDATLETKTIYMAIRYTAVDQDYWDNNDNKNYEIVIKPTQQQQEKEDTGVQEVQKQKEDIKVLAQRYDFTASLSAARKPWSPPPSPPGSPREDDNNLSTYTPPVFFPHNSGITTPPTPLDEHLTTTNSPLTTAELTKTLNILSLQDPITHHADGYQRSYTDFVNKYCFYNPTTSFPVLS